MPLQLKTGHLAYTATNHLAMCGSGDCSDPMCMCVDDSVSSPRTPSVSVDVTLNETTDTYTDAFGFGCTGTACPNVDGVYALDCGDTVQATDCVLLCTYTSFGQTKYVWGALHVQITYTLGPYDGTPCTHQVVVNVRTSVLIKNNDPSTPTCNEFTVLRSFGYFHRAAAACNATVNQCECLPSGSIPLDETITYFDIPGACDVSPTITVSAV